MATDSQDTRHIIHSASDASYDIDAADDLPFDIEMCLPQKATPTPTVTRADVDRLEREWWTAQTAARTFDEAISEPFYSNSVNAHTAYLVAWSIYMNQPWAMPCAEDRAKLERAKLDAAMAIKDERRSIQISNKEGAPNEVASSNTALDISAGNQEEVSVGRSGTVEAGAVQEAVSIQGHVTPTHSAFLAQNPISSIATSKENADPQASISTAVAQSPEGRITGTVTFFNQRAGYGYIKSDKGESFHFNTRGFQHQTMSIKAGDMVTFQRTQYSPDSMPRATLVLVDGYVPAQTAYTPPQERVSAARETVQAQRATRKQHGAAKRENARKNAESVARTLKGKGA